MRDDDDANGPESSVFNCSCYFLNFLFEKYNKMLLVAAGPSPSVGRKSLRCQTSKKKLFSLLLLQFFIFIFCE
jgi:hypothetical protein